MNRNLKTTLLTWPVATLSAMALCGITGFVAQQFGFDFIDKPQDTLKIMLESHGWRLALNLFLVVVFAPVMEEALFRGVLLGVPRWVRAKLCARKGRAASAHEQPYLLGFAIFSSVVFSACHYLQSPGWDNAFLALFTFGMIQCWLYWKTNALWCPMLLHALHNGFTVATLFLFPQMAQ